MADPFNAESLAHLLEPDADRPELLKRRESKTLELKANFSLSDDAKVDYARTMAAFANREGGYILFGVRDKPHILDGMTNTKLDELDPRALSQFLQNHFSPNIDWQHLVHTVEGKRFGIIFVAPTRRKPVVCTAANSKGKGLRDGDVFYRYQGETRLIGSAELHSLIEDRIEAERHSWQDLLRRTAQVRPASAALLDLDSGRLTGAGGALVIGEELLDKVKFIQEGHFEEGGEPTLRVIGDVEVVRTEAVPIEHPVPTMPHVTHPWLQGTMRDELQKTCAPEINQYDLQCVRAVHNVTENDEWHVFNSNGKTKWSQYSEAYIDWLKAQYATNPDFFKIARSLYKQSRAET